MVYKVVYRLLFCVVPRLPQLPFDKYLLYHARKHTWIKTVVHAERLQGNRLVVEEVVREVGQSHAGVGFIRLRGRRKYRFVHNISKIVICRICFGLDSSAIMRLSSATALCRFLVANSFLISIAAAMIASLRVLYADL